MGPPPPRYNIDFVSGQLGILILEVPSAELDTVRYRQAMDGLRPKKDADEILKIKLYMREKFVRYRNKGGDWAFEPPSIFPGLMNGSRSICLPVSYL